MSATSPIGTFQTRRSCLLMSVYGGTAENICSQRVFRILTRTGRYRTSGGSLARRRYHCPAPGRRFFRSRRPWVHSAASAFVFSSAFAFAFVYVFVVASLHGAASDARRRN